MDDNFCLFLVWQLGIRIGHAFSHLEHLNFPKKHVYLYFNDYPTELYSNPNIYPWDEHGISDDSEFEREDLIEADPISRLTAPKAASREELIWDPRWWIGIGPAAAILLNPSLHLIRLHLIEIHQRVFFPLYPTLLPSKSPDRLLLWRKFQIVI